MVRVSSAERKALEERGLLRHKRVKKGIVTQEPNFCITSKTHKSRAKTCYVAEEPRIMRFLENLKNHNNNKNNNFNKKNFYTKRQNNKNYSRPKAVE